MTLKPPVQAPQSAFGFSIQKSRMIYHLLTATEPNDVISLEVDEDVSVRKIDGSLYLEQITSSQDDNPISNKAVKPWHTLANWVAGMSNNMYPSGKTKFVLYVLQNRNMGSLIKKMHEAKNIDEAKKALKAIKKKFDDEGISDDKKEALKTIFDPEYEAFVLEIIVNFQVQVGNSKADCGVLSALENEPYQGSRLNHFSTFVQGRVTSLVDELHASKQRAIISRKDFLLIQKEFNDRYCESTKLTFVLSQDEKGSADDMKLQLENSPNYIKQLKLIEADQDFLLSAAADFFNTSVYKSKMAEGMEYSSDDYSSFEDELISSWQNEKMFLDTPELGDVELGKKLCASCCKHKKTFANRETEDFFVRGSYHALADAPLKDLRIGWHRKYKEKLG